MPKSIEETKRIVNAAMRADKNDNETFLEEVFYTLIPEIQVSKDEFEMVNVINKKAISTYMALDNDDVTKFSEDIDSLIETSNLDNYLKAELKSSNSILANSTLIWREVK